MLTLALIIFGVLVIYRFPEVVIAIIILGVIVAILPGCDHYRTAQLPQCQSHCTFTDGGREVTVAKQP